MKKRYYIYILALFILALYFGYSYIYQDHRNIETESANFVLEASAFSEAFVNSPNQAELKFINKTIEVTGVITDLNQTDITLDQSIFCQFSTAITPPQKVDTTIKIKGRCIGYDDLLEQVKLDQCSIVKD
ncbi:hypothetical protein RBH94_10815 [Aestuariibaculum sp. YM273]|uniref:OB-fold protein n=1 Tax=Aestuariibaculum sp. YM273 TaxID=3070659 RepID=UPI0027DE73BE|nr:hypothetical protein [Aestuariibaculum sp. YM273]WMI64551.1 hypothetical protein RBH94_10815 [Aestuariibaculum sp. YM273]